MKKNKLAFSLIELAAVVLIIGLITAGIMKGTSLIRSSRLASARSLTVKSHINEIPGLAAWYETSMIESFRTDQITNTVQVSEWRDISPGSITEQKNKLTRVGTRENLTYKTEGINNLPSIQFAATCGFSLNNFYQGPLGQSTIFMVMRPTATPSASLPSMTLLDSSASALSGNSYFSIITNKIMINLGSSQGTASGSNVPAFTANYNYILAVYYDNTNSRAYVNDAVTMAGGAIISPPGTNPLDGLTIANVRSLASASQFTGLISEVIVYERLLSSDERKSVMSYLSKKYKIRVTGT